MQKKALSLLLIAMMLLSVGGTCFGAVLDMPGVTIAVNDIKGETMEVAIKVSGHADSKFKSVGAVVQYDTDKLQPIRWATDAAIELRNVAVAKDGWASATAVESVSPDIVSGKPAMAFTSGGKGYLYMGAETAIAQNFKEDTQVITVRFRYENGANFDTAKGSVQFAEDNGVAFHSPVKGQMIYQTEDTDNGAYKFYYINPLTEDGDGNITTDTPADGDVVSKPDKDEVTSDTAISAGTGTANPDDFVSYTFYDWDGTMLGSRIIAKDTGSLIDPNLPELRQEYVNADGTAKYTDAELASRNVAPLVPEGTLLSNHDGSITTKSKAGYIYAGWVDYNQPSTPRVSRTVSDGQTITGSGIELIPLTGSTENKIVRAAYNEKKFADGGIGTSNRNNTYVLNHSAFVAEGSSSVKTTLTIQRANTSRKSYDGVFLSLTLRPYGLGETKLSIPLGDEDIETYELVMPKLAYETYTQQYAVNYTVVNGEGTTMAASKGIRASEMEVK